MIGTPPTGRSQDPRIGVSFGVIAWNEEESIEAALGSLWQQSIFQEISRRGLRSEIICVANGCTDGTVGKAKQFFKSVENEAAASSVSCRVVEVNERGKNNAWNLFVHSFSGANSACLFLMDADIVIQGEATLWNMYSTLERDPAANVAVDRPIKDVALRQHKSVRDRLSIAASGLTRSAPAQLTGQLYCIRSQIARQIYLPRDLAACEDGFIKTLVCTDLLTNESSPRRIVLADGAEHVFQSYQRLADLLRNQKRQMIGQTIVHLLVDKHLKNLPLSERVNLAATIRVRENLDHDWLKRLIAQHLSTVKYFWRLFPNLLHYRFNQWRSLPLGRRLTHFPPLIGWYLVTMVASCMAFQSLRKGSINYWPDTRSPGLLRFGGIGATNVPPSRFDSTAVHRLRHMRL